MRPPQGPVNSDLQHCIMGIAVPMQTEYIHIMLQGPLMWVVSYNYLKEDWATVGGQQGDIYQYMNCVL